MNKDEAILVLGHLKSELKSVLTVKAQYNPNVEEFKSLIEKLGNEAIALQKAIKLFEVLSE